MSLYTNALAAAADTQDIQAGGEGFLNGLSNALTAGATGAVISGLGSIYNTAAAGFNAIGADIEQIDTYKKLADIDTNWAKYYQENQSAIDVVGFIGASIIPGGLAIKGLNAVRAGNASNAFGRSLGFARTKQAEALDAALAELAVEGGTIFTRINKSKMAAMGWGVADQALTAAAFETGVALTMKQSPLLADDSWWDIGKTAIIGAAFGGVIGGAIDGVILNRGFKEAVSKIDARQRGYDYQQVLDKFNLSGGDKAYGIIDSMLRLPESVLEKDAIIDLSFRIARGTENKKLDISKLLTDSLRGAQRTAMQDFKLALNKLSTSDDEAAAGVARLALTKYTELQAKGASPSAIRDQLGDLLFNLKSVRPATDLPTTPSEHLWYFTKTKPDDFDKIKSVEDWKKAYISHSPIAVESGGQAYSKPYVFIGNEADMKTVFGDVALIGRSGTPNGFPTLAEAWKAGKHVAFNTDGTVRVNDSSRFWKRIDDPVYDSSRYLNTRTGAVTENAVLTAADRVPVGKHLGDKGNITRNAVYLPIKEGSKVTGRTIRMEKFDPTGDVEYFTARHAWASQLEDAHIPDRVDSLDFSLLDRLRTVTDPAALERISIYSGDDLIGAAADLNIPALIKGTKLSAAQDAFATAYEAGKTLDIRELAYKLNTDAKWLEGAVATRFRDSLSGELLIADKTIKNLDGLSRDLKEYMVRENIIAEFAHPQQFQELGFIRPDMGWREKRLIIMDQVAMTGGQFVTGELAWSYRVQAAIAASKAAGAVGLGDPRRAAQLIDLTQDAAKLADSTGVGAGMLYSSNASYGELLKLWSQNTGKNVHLWINEDVADVVNTFATVSNRLLADKSASAELGIVTNLLRSTDEKYIFNPANPKQLMLKELKGLDGEKLSNAIREGTEGGRRLFIDIESDVAAEFLSTHRGLNGTRVDKRIVLANSKGLTSNYDPDVVYVPPIDTTYFKHFAFVKPVEGKAFGTSEVAMVFGRDAAELNKRIAQVDKTNFEIITKADTEKFHKAKGDYDFDKTINEPRINSELKRTGALHNFYPEVRGENIVEDYLRWHQNQASRLVRDSVETYYAQQVAELRKLGESYVEVATSKFSGTLRTSKSEVINPYDDYVKTALDVSKRSEYTFFHQANEFVDALGTRAYQALQKTFGDAKQGIVTWEEANRIAERHGIRGPYQGDTDFFVSNVPRDRNLAKEAVAKANLLLANFVLRFDFANAIINTISTPLLLSAEMASIKTLVGRGDAALMGKLADLTSVKVPGQELAVPSTNKLLFNAVKNFWGPNKEELITRYKANGDIKDVLDQYHSMMNDLAMRPDYRAFAAGTERAFEKAATLTGNNWSEQFTRFVSADVMRQLSDPLVEAGKLSLKEQNAYISTFVNRVQGNYISSQRPIAFQGVLGNAIGLFQTYSFNLLQQLFRHVGNRDKRAIATMYGMQAGLFGLNGTPLFEAVNTHIIGNAAINDGHYDAYSLAPAVLGKEVGDWLMYGTASAFPAFGDKSPSLYSRGDINPRHISVLPLTPTAIPAVDASIRLVSNLADMGKKLIGGADISQTLLQGLEHNGISRPLAGFAQVLAGQSTTSRGGLISASSDLSLIASAARIAGSRPMDESLALNAMYRIKAYQAADRDRVEHLGEKVKSYLYKGEFPPDDVIDGFMKDYAAAGGRVENFNRSMQTWMKDANISVVEKMRAKMNSSYGQRLNEIMGGTPLEDSRHQEGGSEQLIPE